MLHTLQKSSMDKSVIEKKVSIGTKSAFQFHKVMKTQET